MDTTPIISEAKEEGLILFSSKPDGRRDEVAQALQLAGYRCVFPPKPEDAVAQITSGDLLLLRVETLTENEIKLVEGVQSLEIGWHIPMVVIADQAHPADATRCVGAGALDCITWPPDMARMLARIKSSIQKKRATADIFKTSQLISKQKSSAESVISSLISITESMTQGKEPIQLLEKLLVETMRITDCEGGSIYSRTDDERLEFVLVRNDMLDINMGGSVGKPIRFEPLRLRDESGTPNMKYVATQTVITGLRVNIDDAYTTDHFDFSGTRQFDRKTGYRSKSFLTIPLKTRRQQVIGVLQLINARNPRTGQVIPFETDLEPAIQWFSLVATAILELYREKKAAIAAASP